jgi:hypothetical protein
MSLMMHLMSRGQQGRLFYAPRLEHFSTIAFTRDGDDGDGDRGGGGEDGS